MKGIIRTSLLLFSFSFLLYAQELKLPSNPLKGRIVFEEKGCIVCHSVSGYGGKIGPDLSRQKYYGSFLQLGSVIWNHIPKMNRKFRELKMERPHFSETEMLDLVDFIYYLRFLGEPGSVANGKKLLSTKGCTGCHKIAGNGGAVAPDFTVLSKYSSPMYLAQAMWNHGPSMQKKMTELKIKHPTFSGNEISDITAYIRQATLSSAEFRLSPGNPSKGKIIFQQKSCTNCHQVNSGKEKTGPNFSRLHLNYSVTEIAGQMWNHSPVMIKYMKEKSIKYPLFKENEMVDVISYLYFLGFEDKPGNPQLGEKVYEEKGCSSCHEAGRKGKGIGPALTSGRQLKSKILILQRMWNHASKMEDLLLIQNDEWPTLTTDETRNLYEYLKSKNTP